MGDVVSPIDVEPNMTDSMAEPSEPVVIAEENESAIDLPLARDKPKSLYGLMKGRIRSTGDIVSPLDEQWDALK